MKKRNSKILDFQSNNSKILCAKFGKFNKQIIVSGDDKNCISVWKFNNPNPIMTLNTQSTSSATTESTSVAFSYREKEIVSGSNRGIINIWDYESQKIATILKGHTTSVNSLAIFPSEAEKDIILSGSYDTNIKLWDIRQKSCTMTFKGHTMQINCLDVSPDGKWIVSGSQDGLVKIWDILQTKCIFTFNLHESPISCCKFNPQEMALASGSNDRTCKYWDLDKNDTTPIQAINFSDDGKIFYSAAHESFKVWKLEKDAQLLDNVESSWKGVLDIQPNENEDYIYGITSYQQNFSLWGTPLSLINQKEQVLQPKKVVQKQKDNCNKVQSVIRNAQQDVEFYDNQNQIKIQPVQNQKPSKFDTQTVQQLTNFTKQNLMEDIENIQRIIFNNNKYDDQTQIEQNNQNPFLQNQFQMPKFDHHNKLLQQAGQNIIHNVPYQQQQIQKTLYNKDDNQETVQLIDQQQFINHINPQQFHLDDEVYNLDKHLYSQSQVIDDNDYKKMQNFYSENIDKQVYQNQQKNEQSYNQNENQGLYSPHQLISYKEQRARLLQLQKEPSLLDNITNQNINQITLQIQDPEYSQQLSSNQQQINDDNYKKQQQNINYFGKQQQLQQQQNKLNQQYQNEMNIADLQVNQVEQNMRGEIQKDMTPSQSMIFLDGSKPLDLNMESFMIKNEHDSEKQLQYELQNEIKSKHETFLKILNTRLKYIQPIQQWLSSQKIQAAVYAISKFDDSSLINDAININQLNINTINVDYGATFVQKSTLLIKSKYQTHILNGLDFTQKLLDKYQDDIIAVKNFNQDSKIVDFSREQRVQKYNKIIEAFKEIHDLSRLTKLTQVPKTAEKAQKLKQSLESLFKKIKMDNN